MKRQMANSPGQEITSTRPTLSARLRKVLQLWAASTSQRLIQTLDQVNTSSMTHLLSRTPKTLGSHAPRDKTCGKIRQMISQALATTLRILHLLPRLKVVQPIWALSTEKRSITTLDLDSTSKLFMT